MQPDLPPSFPPPPPIPAEVRDIRHFTPDRIGMPPEIGGMGREDLRTWLPSNVLMPRATSVFSPSVQEHFANRQLLRRPSPLPEGDGAHLPDGSLYVARYARDGNRPYPSEEDQVSLARHELLHALSYEMLPYRDDLSAGLPALRGALARSGWSVPPGLVNDPDHIFTWAGEGVIAGLAPPALAGYFAEMLRK